MKPWLGSSNKCIRMLPVFSQLTKANETTLVSRPPIYVFSCRWAVIINILLFWGRGFLELIGTAQIIKKAAWLAC